MADALPGAGAAANDAPDIPMGLREIWTRHGLDLTNAALKAAQAGQPIQGIPADPAIRAACAELRNGAALCDCTFDARRIRIPCLTAIGRAAEQLKAPTL